MPQIPGAALSGMRTYIEGNGREGLRDATIVGDQDDDEWPLRDPEGTQRITVQHDLSTHWENVSLHFPPRFDPRWLISVNRLRGNIG